MLCAAAHQQGRLAEIILQVVTLGAKFLRGGVEKITLRERTMSKILISLNRAGWYNFICKLDAPLDNYCKN
jgi:hypothetical protein